MYGTYLLERKTQDSGEGLNFSYNLHDYEMTKKYQRRIEKLQWRKPS